MLRGGRGLEDDQIHRKDAFEELGGAMKSTLLTGLFIFALGLLLAGPGTFAQGVGSSGGISGTLTDPAGGGIPKATIVADGAEKGIRPDSVTDANGQHESALPPPPS